MANRKGEAVWEGSLMDGNGTMRTGSGSCTGPYTYASRFENGAGTNPEELIAAAHAGCFSMAFSGDLGKAGFTPQRIHTVATATIEKVDGRNTITRIHLDMDAQVPNITEQVFQQMAKGAKEGCPVSRALGGVEISLTAKLVKG
jgi:lipoyl-dependent peroxiredoxin